MRCYLNHCLLSAEWCHLGLLMENFLRCCCRGETPRQFVKHQERSTVFVFSVLLDALFLFLLLEAYPNESRVSLNNKMCIVAASCVLYRRREGCIRRLATSNFKLAIPDSIFLQRFFFELKTTYYVSEIKFKIARFFSEISNSKSCHKSLKTQKYHCIKALISLVVHL